jgi:hypothetical protein
MDRRVADLAQRFAWKEVEDAEGSVRGAGRDERSFPLLRREPGQVRLFGVGIGLAIPTQQSSDAGAKREQELHPASRRLDDATRKKRPDVGQLTFRATARKVD